MVSAVFSASFKRIRQNHHHSRNKFHESADKCRFSCADRSYDPYVYISPCTGLDITTAETKFIPKEAVPITLGEDQQVKIRLIDSVGFLVKGASGQTEDGKERMVKTPWFEQAIPFREAARIGTQKVIQEHSTIGIVVTTDGSFGELPRDNFSEAEEKAIQELKKQQKPFIVLVNSQMPYKDAAPKNCLWEVHRNFRQL